MLTSLQQPASVKLEPLECDEDHRSDNESDIQQSPSEQHSSEMARRWHPVLLLKTPEDRYFV